MSNQMGVVDKVSPFFDGCKEGGPCCRVMLVVVDSADAMSPCAFHCLRAVSIMMTSYTDKLDAVQSSLRSHTVYQGVSLSGQTNSIEVLTTRLDQCSPCQAIHIRKTSELHHLVFIKDH
jgi:hypothetical protein